MFQINSRTVRRHFSSIMALNKWKMIAEKRSYFFRWRSRFRRRRVCLSSLMPVLEASYPKAQAESDLWAQISGSIVEVQRSGNTSRGTVTTSTDFFPINACALGSSLHCTKVYCSLPHAFTFENVCCLAKEMTNPQYKCLLSLPLLLNFVFTVVAFHLLNYSLRRNSTRFCEWLPLSVFLVMRMRTFHLLVDTIRSELELPVITPQLTIKMAAQAKHKLFQNIFSTRFF